MENARELNKMDPLKKQPEMGTMGDNLSPMEPPESFAPPAGEKVPLNELHPFLRQFSEEHISFMEELKNFEETILEVQKNGFTRELDQKLKHFFHFFDHEVIPHNRKEEATLFPLLNKKLIASGEHSKGGETLTGVDLMEDDHIKAIQLIAVVFNFLGVAMRLPDTNSRLIVLDIALEQGKSLVELLRLHIFREDNVIFSSAHKLISSAEFNQMQLNS